ncbi:hypothetical protein BKA93DRAFT_163876 [Sparassis latifolia]
MHGKVATPFIWDMIHQHAQHLLGSSMRKIYNRLLSGHLSRGTAGSIFEYTAHHVLSAVGTQSYAIRCLSSGHNSSSQTQWDLSMTSQAVVFEKISQISGNLAPRTYYRPLNSISRFTTSLDQSIKVQGLQRVANILPTKSRYRKNWKLVFVVPTDIEPEFKYQLYEPPSRETWEKRVEQYVMRLSAEQLFPTAGMEQVVGSSSADAEETNFPPHASESSMLAGTSNAVLAALAPSLRSVGATTQAQRSAHKRKRASSKSNR